MAFPIFRSPIRAAMLAMLLPAMSACTLVDQFFEPVPPDSPPPPVAQILPAPPAPRPAASEPQRVARLPLPPAPAPGRETVSPDIEIKLVGLSRPETLALLGPPSGESERSPAKVWQYLTGDCSVDVYFYLDVARNDFYALHYEARASVASAGSTTNGIPAAEWCVRRVHDSRRPR